MKNPSSVNLEISRSSFEIFQFLHEDWSTSFFFLLKESQTIEDFGAALHLMRADLEHLRSVFIAVENGDLGLLKSLGIKDSELGDVKFFLEKLVDTGFLD